MAQRIHIRRRGNTYAAYNKSTGKTATIQGIGNPALVITELIRLVAPVGKAVATQLAANSIAKKMSGIGAADQPVFSYTHPVVELPPPDDNKKASVWPWLLLAGIGVAALKK